MLTRIAARLSESSLRDLITLLVVRMGWHRRLPQVTLPTAEFLRSSEYERMMMEGVPCTGEYGRHEAFTYSRSYQNRHRKYVEQLSVFRWRGVQEHLDLILREVTTPGAVVVDFGGAGCPLGLGSIVVDRLPRDAAGRPVTHSSLDQLSSQVDTVFACHVLEHIEDLHAVLGQIRSALKPQGKLITLVPSYTNEGWRAAVHSNERFGSHRWTFGLSEDSHVPDRLPNYLQFDQLVRTYFHVHQVSYCGDDSIFCYAEKLLF